MNIKKHYMIVNPPKDLIELKELVEKFNKKHPIENKLTVKEGKTRYFYVNFYKESEDLPIDWQPHDNFMFIIPEDRIEDHKEDLIACIYWSDKNPQKRYWVYSKSKEGKLIKSIHFTGDQIDSIDNYED